MRRIPTIPNEELGLSEKDIELIVADVWNHVRDGSYRITYNAEDDENRKAVIQNYPPAASRQIFSREKRDITLASENALAKDWLSLDEELARKDL